MATLQNAITIRAPIEKIWEALSNIEELERYDPSVKKSTAVSLQSKGVGSTRKVDMKDGKNWFEEKCTVWEPNRSLTYELTACTFPIHELKHSYSFAQRGDQVEVRQLMEYRVKYGFLGKALDVLVVKKQTDSGIKKFFAGLKAYAEQGK